MIRFFLHRAAHALATLAVAVVLVFVAVRMLPNNPVLARFGQHPVKEQIAAEMALHGWDQPLHIQLGRFISQLVLHGDLGPSFSQPGRSVSTGLRETVPATIELTAAAVLLALPLGLLLGISAAVFRNRWPDYLSTSFSLLGTSIPVFFLALCLMAMFTSLPTTNRLPIGNTYDTESHTGFFLLESFFTGRWDVLRGALWHLILPAMALATIPLATIARLTRSSLVEVLSADYVRTARAKGAAPWRVVLRHALPNAAVPIANIAGFQVGLLLTGAVLTETVFNWPGLGDYMARAVKASDYAVVQGGALVVAVMFVSINLLLDLLFAWLDPRLRVK